MYREALEAAAGVAEWITMERCVAVAGSTTYIFVGRHVYNDCAGVWQFLASTYGRSPFVVGRTKTVRKMKRFNVLFRVRYVRT